jgi:uncharacterized protein YcbX
MRSHTLNAAPSSEYPWIRTIELRAMRANIQAAHKPVRHRWKLYICGNEPDAADATDTVHAVDVAPSAAFLRHVTG